MAMGLGAGGFSGRGFGAGHRAISWHWPPLAPSTPLATRAAAPGRPRPARHHLPETGRSAAGPAQVQSHPSGAISPLRPRGRRDTVTTGCVAEPECGRAGRGRSAGMKARGLALGIWCGGSSGHQRGFRPSVTRFATWRVLNIGLPYCGTPRSVRTGRGNQLATRSLASAWCHMEAGMRGNYSAPVALARRVAARWRMRITTD